MSYTLVDILLMLLIVAGIAALVFLAKLLMSVSKITDTLGETVKDNRPNLDATIADLPRVTDNLNKVLNNTQFLISELEPKIVQTLADVNTVTAQVSNITTNVSDTVEVVGLATADTISRFSNSFTKATNKPSLVKGLFNAIVRR